MSISYGKGDLRINGMIVIKDKNLTKIDGIKKIKQKWIDRLKFWRGKGFYNKYYEVPNIIPSDEIYVIDNKIICHPKVYQDLMSIALKDLCVQQEF